MGELRDSSTILDLGSRWRFTVSFTVTALPLKKEHPVLIGEEAGWAPEPV
jgi:hypothetical protein